MNESDVVFRICVPTYNRGRKALDLATHTLPLLEPGWNLTVIDNCSHKDGPEYGEISRLARESEGRLTYIRNPHNVEFRGNYLIYLIWGIHFTAPSTTGGVRNHMSPTISCGKVSKMDTPVYLKCLRAASGKPILIVSDEDRPGMSIIPLALKLFKEHPTVGIVRGSVEPLTPGSQGRNSAAFRDEMCSAGEEALRKYALANTYISGTVYNIPLLDGFGLVDRLEKDIARHSIYPHLYFESLACAVADVAIRSEVSCLEGPPHEEATDPEVYGLPYSFGGRADVFIVLRNGLRDAVEMSGHPFNTELFSDLYLRHTAKSLRLVGVTNAPLYEKTGIDVGVAVRSFAYFACAAMIRLKECEPHRKFMMEEIDRLARNFGG